jgi:hypothetical protein
MQTSTRFGVSYPVAARTDSADVAVHIGNVVTGLEKAVRYDSGTLAARPTSSVGTPGITGRHYFATDESQMYFDYGTGWIGIMVQNQKQISTLNATAAASGYASYITGDTQPRFVINADGKHQWGAGGASAIDPLATLYRSGAGQLMTDATVFVNQSLYVQTTAHAIWVQNISPAFSVLLVKAAADTQQRLRILGDGKIQWGPGGVTVEDTNLYRSAAGILKTDSHFAGAQQVHSNHTAVGAIVLSTDTGLPGGKPQIYFGNPADTVLLRPAANSLSTPGSMAAIQFIAAPTSAGVGYGFSWAPAVYNAGSRMFTGVRVLGDAQPNFVIDADGGLNWAAGGSAAIDVILWRSAAGVLSTSGDFRIANGYIRTAVPNSAGITLPAIAPKRLPIYDAAGVIAGYIPVYANV